MKKKKKCVQIHDIIYYCNVVVYMYMYTSVRIINMPPLSTGRFFPSRCSSAAPPIKHNVHYYYYSSSILVFSPFFFFTHTHFFSFFIRVSRYAHMYRCAAAITKPDRLLWPKTLRACGLRC